MHKHSLEAMPFTHLGAAKGVSSTLPQTVKVPTSHISMDTRWVIAKPCQQWKLYLETPSQMFLGCR